MKPTNHRPTFYVIVSHNGKASYLCEPSTMQQHEANFAVVQRPDGALSVWKDRYGYVGSHLEVTPQQAHVLAGAHMLLVDWHRKNPTADQSARDKAMLMAASLLREAGIELSEDWCVRLDEEKKS